ncbi:MAG TPA: site-2 protease family protein [Candidatus Acidoferrales bacterium]|nr:site-2 protease family protein [Candidatus Acidoferrales bacterium]
MNSIRKGSIPLFRLAGIAVSLHWSWFFVAAFEISGARRAYSSIGWNVAEYLALFLIVLLHEFGHALACRQVGGIANQIVLWPLGGVAYVNPPQRPGATLWSLAAGPLVNVALVPALYAAVMLAGPAGGSNLYALLRTVEYINLVLLVFNMLPIYPLDGGQILRSLLWFGIGRARSLMVAVVVGFIGVAGLIALALWQQSAWVGVVAVFILLNCWSGLRHAQALLKIAKLPRRPGFACPSCKTAPPIGNYWGCAACKTRFDTFETQAVCPQCKTQFPVTGCLDCGRRYPIAEWRAAGFAATVATPAGGVSPVLPSRG